MRRFSWKTAARLAVAVAVAVIAASAMR